MSLSYFLRGMYPYINSVSTIALRSVVLTFCLHDDELNIFFVGLLEWELVLLVEP